MIENIGDYTSIGECKLWQGEDDTLVYRVCVEIITPEKAKTILKNNINRKLNTKRVNQYAADMSENRWKINGVPLIMTSNGFLKDGQHRLNALIKANMTLPFLMVHISEKYESEANNYDIGMTRSVSDLRILSGKGSVSTRTAAAVNFILNYNFGMANSKAALKTICAEKIDEYTEYLSILDVLPRSASKGNKAAYWAAIVTAYKNGYSKEMLIEFNKVFQSGIMSKPEHTVIIALRNRLFSEKGTNYVTQMDEYLRTQTALKCFQNGEVTKRILATKEFYKWKG